MFDNSKVRGFFRVQLVQPDPENPEEFEVVGDSGEVPNQITNDGFLGYMIKPLANVSTNSNIQYAGIGTGGAPAASDTVLAGEQSARTGVTATTSNTSKAVQFTGTFSSAGSFVTATKNISNIGLFMSVSGGTLFAGAAYNSSSCATNQNVNFTYTITLT